MKSRPKLSGAPLAYALHKVEGTTDPYNSFGTALWVENEEAAEGASAVLKELVFLRTSIVNECET